MKSFAIAALAGAVSAAVAPPAYATTSEMAPPAYETMPPVYESTSSMMEHETSSSMMEHETSSSMMEHETSSSMVEHPVYPTTSSMEHPPVYPTTTMGTAPAYSPKPTMPAYNNATMEHPTGVYVTQIVTSFETYCPKPTTLTYGPSTYTVTEATTLTITHCPGGCAISTPAVSYKPSYTTEVYTSFVTTCPEKTTVTYGPSTYTVESSTVLTVTECPGGCTVTEQVPATYVVPVYTTVCPSPSAPTTITIGTVTYPVTKETTIVATAPTSYATYTSVMTKPAAPTSVVIESTTYPVTEATTVTYVAPTTQGYTVTGVYSSVYSMPPVYTTPAGPVAPPATPSVYMPPANGTSSGPMMPVQSGSGAEKIVAGGAGFAAVVAALFL